MSEPYTCYADDEDLTAAVRAALREGKFPVSQMQKGPKTVTVTCSQGHTNIFEVP